MDKKTFIVLIVGAVIFTAGIIIFIHFSNDHIECENHTEYSVGENGEKITTEKHICKERFNL